jgi:peptide/nickel transport system ATP-binding protein
VSAPGVEADVTVGAGRPAAAFLDVRDLRVEFATEDGVVRAVDGVSYTVDRGKTLAVVGESGSGKSVTSNAVMGLLNPRQATITGQALLDGEDLVAATPDRVRLLRGSRMAMIFQDPLSSLHPFKNIGKQLVEAVRIKKDVDKATARARALEMLERVGIPNAAARIDEYPHQLSGGMRQRVMIAMALINDPEMLIADEPTTALDVTVQAQIIELMRDLQKEFNTAIVLITHDLGVVADMADDVVVMYGGRVVESAPATELYARPRHPYTRGLMASVPKVDGDTSQRLVPIEGQPPDLAALPPGCAFAPRCRHATERCSSERPELRDIGARHRVACLFDL